MAREFYDTKPLEPLVAQGFVLLTPNLRLARRIKTEWDSRRAAAGERVWEPLEVLPLENWLSRRWHEAIAASLLPAQVLLGTAQVLTLWQKTIAAEERATDRYHLLRPAAAAEIAHQARETLLRWQVDPSATDIRQLFRLDTDCDTFLRWLDSFEQALQAAGQVTATDGIRQLQACAARMPQARVALLEFEDIPPLLRNTVDALCPEAREWHSRHSDARRLLYACEDKRTELEAVARWAVCTHRANPEQSIGIVLSDMATDRVALDYLLRREFACLGDSHDSLPVNFSTGLALDRTPVVRDALAALAMGLPNTTVPAVVNLMHSRFLDLPDADSPLAARLLKRLFDEGRETVQVAELRYTASEITLGDSKGLALGRHLMGVSRMRALRQQALPSTWVELFCEMLAIWGWPGSGSLDSLEYQQVELWYRNLDEFCRYDAVCEPMAFGAALQLLRDSCSRQVSQPRTADSRIQVLGPLEAAGLEFDQLWLVGMQAGNWPAPPRPNPFIPVSLQRQRQMPHATPEREWAFAAGLITQYGQAATELRASYCRQLEGVPELPSALLEDFAPTPLDPTGGSNPDWLVRWQGRQMEYLEDGRAPVAGPAELADIGGGSALLEDQSQCPFRAFARRRLQLEPPAAFGTGLSAADRGSLLHAALYALWGRLEDHRTLLTLDEGALAAVVEEAAAAALDGVPAQQRRALGRACWQLEQRRLVALLQEWLEVERLRAEFVVSQREEEVTLELAQLSIRLRVDRIDLLPDGSQVIIDYKSGRSSVQDWLGERPGKPQLLLYGIAAPDAAAALAFAQVRPRDCRFAGLGSVAAAPGIRTDIDKVARGRMDAQDWATLNQRWRDNLEHLAREFVSGQAEVDPLTPASCTWCGLQPLCRIGSVPVGEDQP